MFNVTKRNHLVWRRNCDVSGLQVAGHREVCADDVLDSGVRRGRAATETNDDHDPAVDSLPEGKVPFWNDKN
jgi:hypothetical protein